MLLDWNLNFTLNGTESTVDCKWISHSWFDLRGNYTKKMKDVANTRMRLAEDALKSEKVARQELHAIHAHRRLSALVTDAGIQEIHELLAWITLKTPIDLNVRLFRATKDDWSDSVMT